MPSPSGPACDNYRDNRRRDTHATQSSKNNTKNTEIVQRKKHHHSLIVEFKKHVGHQYIKVFNKSRNIQAMQLLHISKLTH